MTRRLQQRLLRRLQFVDERPQECAGQKKYANNEMPTIDQALKGAASPRLGRMQPPRIGIWGNGGLRYDEHQARIS
jgi:hypothetical protein